MAVLGKCETCGFEPTVDYSCVNCLERENAELLNAIVAHHSQKADDRCIEDDDRLYAAANLPPCDRRVGDKAAMLRNCERFIARRCEGGGWPTYAELEARNKSLLTVCESTLPRVIELFRAYKKTHGDEHTIDFDLVMADLYRAIAAVG